MFITLLLVTFIIAFVSSFIVVQIFDKPITAILNKVVTEELSSVWGKYIKFVIYIVGISGGVRIWELEKYVDVKSALNADRWVLEVYRTVIVTLQSIAWMLLIFFIFVLIAYVIVETKRKAGK